MATCDVAQLLADAKCFMCLNPKQARQAMAQLLCDMLASQGGVPAACAEYFEDGFGAGADDQPLASPWGAVPLVDSLVYGSQRAVDPPDGAGANYLTSFTMLNGWLEVDFLGPFQAIFARTADLDLSPITGDYYLAGVAGDGVLVLSRVITSLGSWAGPVAIGDKIRLTLSGGTISVQVNGVTRITATDPAPIATPGYFGMIGHDDDAIFDNFKCCSND